MEGVSSDGEKKPPETCGGGGGGGGGEPKTKRKMKTPSQLEVLEKTYQVSTYPSETMRAELSEQLGLSDRQLQMWFCHRRLKDRKPPSASGGGGGSGKRSKKGEASPAAAATVGVSVAVTSSLPVLPVGPKEEMVIGGEMGNEHRTGSGSGTSPYGRIDPRRGYVGRHGIAVPRISGHGRYCEPAQSVAELRAVAFVEAQLGESLRKDGPALGMEFDPLPPGAFGAPMATSIAPQKPTGRAYEYERADVKPVKGSSRDPHEYQFLPEQPSFRSESYERVAQSHYYGSPSEGPGTKTPPLSSGHSYVNGYEEVPVTYGVPSQVPCLNLIPQGKVGCLMPSTSGDYEAIARKSPYMTIGMESPFSAHPNSVLDNVLIPSERRVILEEDAGRLERKRKTDESRVAKEIEAHEKKMRKELERQDILRRKREEQTRKDMERQDRERRKEEERLLREKQREEERYQREQRREMERREKFLLKESIRVEKMKQKEELRREREAARQKAANDRAVAKRLAKESTELIEDERLELMEIAASRKGLTSILSLDSETLQNLDAFRDMLRVFPPKSVQLKKPFAMRPWMGSEENVGNLLMVWRFLITFADVLGLWPFTLDEFVQAFHDYDPRLLGEIHISLLRTIIKDIEDVARTPSTGLGVNQNSVANPIGGHPQVVEGAYTWGFDIRSWQCNLSPLSWPEILRQFALSAGFGPKLKKRNIEQAYSREENEGTDGIDIISNLRTGAAVENAVSIMRERGYSNPRRSRHRLTPGTVKFAAFHVLSLEGGNGLNILEVAERIQKSGLRDLTTSKTPEASIAAALSRDTKLFERTAPSTYCVRSPYRKDPDDGEALLSSAREKIRAFKSGFADGVEADVDGMEPDDVEKEEDSESDTVEDPELDDLGTELTPNKDANLPYDGTSCLPKVGSDNGAGDLHSTADKTPNGVAEVGDVLSSVKLDSIKELNGNGCFVEESMDVVGVCQEGNNTDHEDTDIDESFPGESWVQGLMEGEYSYLSVEERLNALVALIGVANEGNTIRIVLEERLEAATALKKQMWAEAQLDKRRFKEEYLMKTPYAAFASNKTESNIKTSAPDSRQSPMLAMDDNSNEPIVNLAIQQKPFHDVQNDYNLHADLPPDKNLMSSSFVAGSDNFALQQSVYAAERCRAQLKSYIGHKAEEMYVYRSLPLGQDRRRNKYWQFIASASCNDPGAGRIFVELHNGGWRLIDSEEAFEALIASLDVHGVRESHLHALLQKVEPLFKESVRNQNLDSSMDIQNNIASKSEVSELSFNPESSGGTDSPSSTVCGFNMEIPEPSSSFKIESGRNNLEVKNAFKRYKNFDEWMWKECYSSVLCATNFGKKRCMELVCRCDSCHSLYFFEDNHCPTCHKTYNAFDTSIDFLGHITQCQEINVNLELNLQRLEYPPPRITLIKALLALVEVYIPPEALLPVWSDTYRKSWGMKLHMSSSTEDLLQVLTLLEGAIKRDFLLSNFQTTDELLASVNTVGYVINDASNLGTVTILPWIPQTTSAVALRLMELDSAIAYLPDQKAKDTEPRHFLKLPSKYTVVRSVQEEELAGPPGDQLEDAWFGGGTDLGFASIRGNRGRGRGRTRGGKSQRRVPSSRGGDSARNVASNERLGEALGGWKGRSSRGKGGRKRGRRSVRKRQKPVQKAAAAVVGRILPEPIIFEKSPPGFSGRDEWNREDSRQMQVDEVDVNDDSEQSEYDNDFNGQVSGDEYDDMTVGDYAPVYNGRPTHLNDYNVDDGDEEDDDHDEVGDDDDDRDEVADDVEEEDMDVDGGEYEQGKLEDVGGYLNADSDDEIEGNRDGGMRDVRDQDDTSESASTDYSSD